MTIPNSQTFRIEQSPRGKTDFCVEVTRIVQIGSRKIYLQWHLRNVTSNTGYAFIIYRSGSAEGPWELVTDDLTDVFLYVDDTFPAPVDMHEPGLFSMNRSLYYRIVVVHAVDGTTETVQEVEGALDRRRRSMVKKLRRDAEIKIRKGYGTEVAVLKRKWWGEPCTYRSATGHVIRAHCLECHGTGVKIGYWAPIYTFGQRTTAPAIAQTSDAGSVEVKNMIVVIPYLPQIDPKDILVFMRDNRRYIIESVNNTEIHTVTVHQEAVVSELSKSSQEQLIAVDAWHSPGWF